MEDFIISCLQHKRCFLCGKCSAQGGFRYLPTTSLVNLALTLHFRKSCWATTAKITSDDNKEEEGCVAGDSPTRVLVSIIDHILASSLLALHRDGEQTRDEESIRDGGSGVGYANAAPAAAPVAVGVASVYANPLQFSNLLGALDEELSGIVRRLADQMKSRSHHSGIVSLVLMLLEPRAKGCKGGWPVCWKEYTCLPSLSLTTSDSSTGCISSGSSSLYKASDSRGDDMMMMKKKTPMVIRDEPFDLGYINYDPSRYLSDLLAKAAAVRSMLSATLLVTGSTFELESMSMIKSPLKNFREKCRFAVNHVYGSRHANTDSFVRYAGLAGSVGGEPVVEGCEEVIGSKSIGRTSIGDVKGGDNDGDGEDDYIEFMIWDDDGKPSYVVEEYPIASKLICTILKPLQLQINRKRSLKHDLSAIHAMTTLSGSAIIRLLYNERVFDPPALKEWIKDANLVVAYLKSCIPSLARDGDGKDDVCELHLTLRARGCKASVNSDSVTERFHISNSSVSDDYASSFVRFPLHDRNSSIGSSNNSESLITTTTTDCSLTSSSSSSSSSDSSTYKNTPFDFSVSYVQSSEGFSNPNAAVNRLCLIWICEVMGKIRRSFQAPFDLLEMYCGNGNHSMAIAKSGCVRYVVGVEINNALVEAARLNAKLNGLEGIVEILQSDSSDFTSRLMRRKSFTSQTRTAFVADLDAFGSNNSVKGESSIVDDASTLSFSSSGGDSCVISSSGSNSSNSNSSSSSKSSSKSSSSSSKSSSSSSSSDIDLTNAGTGVENENTLSDTNKISRSSFSSQSHTPPSPSLLSKKVPVPVTYNFTVVLVDPPRCGLDQNTLNLTINYEHIVYISCNPSSLMRDLTVLLKTHSIERLTCFDQFAYAKDHIETAVHLMKLKQLIA